MYYIQSTINGNPTLIKFGLTHEVATNTIIRMIFNIFSITVYDSVEQLVIGPFFVDSFQLFNKKNRNTFELLYQTKGQQMAVFMYITYL